MKVLLFFLLFLGLDFSECQRSTLCAGLAHTCALKTNGDTQCWGQNNYGQAPSNVVGPFQTIACGDYHTCAIKMNSDLQCWGRNGNGQADNRPGPFQFVAAGYAHTCVIKTNGDLQCWGWNNFGQAPAIVSGTNFAFVAVDAGNDQTCALNVLGDAYCWGKNNYGQAPPSVTGPFQAISVGERHTCAVKADGDLQCWGIVLNGIFTPYNGDDSFIAVSSGNDFSSALQTNGDVQYFGVQYGIAFGPYVSVAAGDRHNCNLKMNGDVGCYGGSGGDPYGAAPGLVTGPFQLPLTNKYLGCWQDTINRDLSTLLQSSQTINNVETCSAVSTSQTMQYFGTQYSFECYGDADFGFYGKAPEWDCNMACSGNSNEICGGTFRNSVWTPYVNTVFFSYVGCYVDDPNRDLPVYINKATVEDCYSACRDMNYKYFGVQYGWQCYCGNKFGSYGKASETDCNFQCNDNPKQICGGDWRNSVYQIRGRIPLETGLTYRGCFVDGYNRDLPNLVQSGPSVTVLSCKAACSGYYAYGVQYGKECWCGNSYGSLGSAPESECSIPCAGNSIQICGGVYRNSVYLS